MSTRKEKLMRVLLRLVILPCAVFSLVVGAGASQATEAKQELRIALTSLGNEVPVHYREQTMGVLYLRLIYDPLVGADNNGVLSKETGLARDWVMSPDGLTWTFNIRKGIKFHDGTELTGNDVKFTLELGTRPDSTLVWAGQLRSTIKSIEVPEPYTVVLHLNNPNLALASMLSDSTGPDGLILPKAYFEKVGFDGFRAKPIGSGPCKWVGQSIGSYIKLETVDNHWRTGVPKYKYVTLLLVPEESTRIAMLKTGEADALDVGRERLPEVKKGGFNVHVQEDAYITGLYPHGQWQNNPLANVKVRKALAISINRPELVKTIFAGLAKPTPGFPLGRLAVKFASDLNLPPYKYDPEEAKRLLREAGFSETNPLTQPMAVYPRAGLPEGPRMMEAIAGYWEKLGLVKVKMTQTDYGAWRKRRMAQDNGGWVSWANQPNYQNIDPGVALYQARWQLGSKELGTQTKRPDIDAIVDKGATTADIEVLRQALLDIYRLQYDDCLMWGVVETDGLMASSKAITKWDMGMRMYDYNLEYLFRR